MVACISVFIFYFYVLTKVLIHFIFHRAMYCIAMYVLYNLENQLFALLYCIAYYILYVYKRFSPHRGFSCTFILLDFIFILLYSSLLSLIFALAHDGVKRADLQASVVRRSMNGTCINPIIPLLDSSV